MTAIGVFPMLIVHDQALNSFFLLAILEHIDLIRTPQIVRKAISLSDVTALKGLVQKMTRLLSGTVNHVDAGPS